MMRANRSKRGRSGVVLVVVLLVVALLALSAYTFSDMMLVEHTAAQTHADMAKTREAAFSGAAMIQAFLMQEVQVRNDLGGIYENPTYFAQQQVHADNDPALSTLFSVTSPAYDSEGYPVGVRFGLENDSGRLNLDWLLELSDESDAEDEEAAEADNEDGDADQTESAEAGNINSTGDPGRDALMRLPGMTLEIADAILDWMDPDDVPREYGAEIDFYSSNDPPYQPRNGPIGAVEELLLVRDVTPDLLFGRDQNRNGMVDENEIDIPIIAEVDETLGSIDLGWAALLTTYSAEVPPTNPNGEPRIDLNGDDVQTLVNDLSAVINQDLATFIGAFRLYGPYDGEEEGQAINSAKIDFSEGSARAQIESVLDLVDAQVRVPGEDDSTVYQSPLRSAASGDLDVLQDYATAARSDEVINGRINVNEATHSVLMAIPGMTASIASTVVSQRDPTLDPLTSPQRHATWLLTGGLCDLETMRQMQPYITTGGSIFRAQVVGYFGDGTGVSRAEVILDATRADIPLLLWKDKTDLGRGFDPQILVGMTDTALQ